MFWGSMQRRILPNGLLIIYVPRDTDTVCIEVNVHAGSNHETPAVAGISHFIEHMLFEGTPRRPDSYHISNEIERLGGDLNAATSNERTFFYVKVQDRHFSIALDVMADIIMNPLFDERIIEKEKRIVIDEIKLVNDQPRYYQWIMFQNALFARHPARNPIYGSESAIKNLTRAQILSYYRTHYTPDNMTIVIVGKVPDCIGRVAAAFGMLKGNAPKQPVFREPAQGKNTIVTAHRKTLQSYMILGYKTPPRSDPDSFAFDIVRAILGRGQSGTIFNEVRTKRGLAYDVGVLHNPNTDFGFLAVYVNTHQKNIPEVKRIILQELQARRSVTATELSEAKTFLEGEYLMHAEDTQKMADNVAFWEQSSSAGSSLEYVKKIRAVTGKAVSLAIERYCRHYSMTIIS
jgi:predicted Zn-dependent peptidase